MLTLTVQAHVARFMAGERPIQMLAEAQVLALALAAVRLYAGFAALEAAYGQEDARLPAPLVLDAGLCLNESEWALVYPLLLLYVERETAIQLEASRGLGIDVFGRSTSEIAGEIAAYEAELPHRAFSQPFVMLV